jgi:hypothetical protein
MAVTPGPFAGEHGNMAFFSLAITGGTVNPAMTMGTGFTLSALTGKITSPTDSTGFLATGGSFPSTYTNTIVGVLPNGHLTTPGVTPANTVVNALYFVGLSTAYADPTLTNTQTDLNNDVAFIQSANGGNPTIIGTYGLQNTVNFGAGGSSSGPGVGNVPEPASIAVLGIGAVGLLGYVYRRRKQVVPGVAV